MTEWTLHARRFIATGDRTHLGRAVAACADEKIGALLNDDDLQQNKQVHPSKFEELRQELILGERPQEACVVNLLGHRFVALGMVDLETYDAKLRDFIRSTCRTLAEQSEAMGFAECQTLFSGLLATGAAKTREDKESFGLFVGAIRAARELVEAEPSLYSSLLAGLLSNYGNALRVAGRTQDATAHLLESLQIRRRLAEHNPQRHLREVASTLSNLAAVYGARKEYRDAEPLLVEAIAMQRELQDAHTVSARKSLAGTLSNLALFCTEQRRFSSARRASEEALEIRRGLAREEPDAHDASVAGTLSNLGMLLDEMREYRAAVASLQEAVDIRRRLSRSQPAVFEADLATSLDNLGNALLMTENSEDVRRALSAYKEALGIRRRLRKISRRVRQVTLEISVQPWPRPRLRWVG